ncbi:MAG: phosphoglucomutase/phosphomannomutase family protein [Blastocatellia bacterium]|nr:phosphoglucomutase/phosphomannomutase family protein [Chloracidobacterium sp.]MBL8183878.1 phosphoglucomutase/phosphomannomutase family protein [Blastocatellia bacterium]HBE81961.1 phosphoglucomutase [Blastocatellia bacterium]HRJ87820.1 phosphoglucomutase/phosphomannomutase family protein [Pyrinomonadaceae bacterium]HRK50276.1 phosphoglucomutase/phosphomannomutase family protein [Pyrinomonadaceae bacterium]
MSIRFGTSGWRAVIADEFTFSNVKRVTNAICSYLKTEKDESGQILILGHDSRFMGEKFASAAAAIAAEKGFRVLKCTGPTPTPTISHSIRDQKAAGAMNFTASHNPPEYQGIKFSTADGAPAMPEITKQIEAGIESNIEAANATGGSIEDFDPRPAYLADLAAKINFAAIADANGRFAYDALWGTGRGYLDKILRDHGLEVETIHDWRDVTFGGRSPEPAEDHLDELREAVTSKKLTLGIATDGDGDRFGIIDSNGAFITANELVALLTDYLAESRGWTQGVARSVATSHLVDRVAAKRGIKLYETPVGFKFIGELINRDEIILGGEESAGLSIRGHYPEKDGLLACLLAAEAVSVRKASLTEQLDVLYKEVGKLESGRIGVKLTDEVAASLKERLAQEPAEIGGRRVEKINRMDGVKFIFADQSWMLMRPSGTEPLVRIYAESESRKDLEDLLEQGRKYLLG